LWGFLLGETSLLTSKRQTGREEKELLTLTEDFCLKYFILVFTGRADLEPGSQYLLRQAGAFFRLKRKRLFGFIPQPLMIPDLMNEIYRAVVA
jgi:hypothetical protein